MSTERLPVPMKFIQRSTALPVVCAITLAIAAPAFAQISYTSQIKPILDQNCAKCHSAADRSSGFDVSSPDLLQKGGLKDGPGVIPGKPDDSAIIQHIEGKREPRMPRGAPPLAPEQIRVLREWIAAGAPSDFVDREQLMATRRNSRLPTAPAARSIDALIAAKWTNKTLPALCDDVAFLRRVYLDIIGVIPTIAEAQRFLSSQKADKRAALIDELLSRNNDYAAHWTPFWEEALGSSTAPITGGIPNHGNHRDWIFRSFAANRPFDVMVAELIDPTMPGHPKFKDGEANGTILQVGYILSNNHTETIQSAANVAQVFMATSMKCASCHNHFLNSEWPQTRFMAFAGLFSSKDLELIRCERKSNQFIPAKFPFEVAGVQQATPVTADERLSLAAALITDPANPRFAKAIVNRLWRRYLGLGLFEPIDDFRSDRPATNPELLDWLAVDFMRSGYDLKHTIRLILNSRTYQSRYNPAEEDHFDVSKPNQPRFYRSPSLRKLTAEQLLDSVILAGSQKLEPEKRIYLDKMTTALTRALGRPASRNEISTARSEEVAVVQSLELLNGEEFHDLVYSGGILDNAAPERLYWAALSRPPSQAEQTQAAKYLRTDFAQTNPPADKTWIENNLPAGAPLPNAPGLTRRLFQNGGAPLAYGPKDVLFAEGMIDPQDPPKQITMQWQIVGQESFVYRYTWSGAANSKHPLPKVGNWVRFAIPLSELTPHSSSGKITGWAFDQDGGKVEWRKAGIRIAQTNPTSELLGDILWALTTSPEFQYIR